MEALTLQTKPGPAIDNINNHDHSSGIGNPINTDGIVDGSITTAKLASGAVSTDKLSTDLQKAIAAISSGNGVSNDSYIARGRKVSLANGLNVSLTEGVDYINGSALGFTASVLALNTNKASLLIDKADGTTTVVDTVDPVTFIDDNTVGMWVFNKTEAGAVIPNIAVGKSAIAISNDLTPSGGITSTSGWFDKAIKFDGTSAFYTMANATNIPSGANEREINMIYTHAKYNGISAAIITISSGTNGETDQLWIGVKDNEFAVATTNNMYKSGIPLEYGKTYNISTKYINGMIKIYLSGMYVFGINITLSTVNSRIYIGNNSPLSQYIGGVIHFIEIRNKVRSDEQTALMSNKLIFPCFYDKVSASYPIISDADKALDYHEWKFNEAGGSTVADSANTLNATVTGTTIVNSFMGNGGKSRKITLSDKIKCGNYSFGTEYTIISTFAYVSNSNGENDILATYNPNNGTTGTVFRISNGKPELWQNNVYVTSSKSIKTLTADVKVFCATTVKAGIVRFYANSPKPEELDVTFTAAPAAPLYLFSRIEDIVVLNGVGEYIAIIPRALTQAEMAKVYDALMPIKGRRNIINDVVTSDAVSLGFIKTDAEKITEYNDADYMYGRREKGFGGNRKVFLGWKYYDTQGTTSVSLKWDNPFGTRKLKLTYVWNFLGANLETEVCNIFSTWNGVANDAYGLSTTGQDITNRITAVVNVKGAALYKGVWQTSGYIGCYAEVLEDYQGVNN